MTTDKLAHAVEAMREATACPEHEQRRGDLAARGLLNDEELPGGWSWIFDEDNPCGACARIAVLAVARALFAEPSEASVDLHTLAAMRRRWTPPRSTTPRTQHARADVLALLDAYEQAVRERDAAVSASLDSAERNAALAEERDAGLARADAMLAAARRAAISRPCAAWIDNPAIQSPPSGPLPATGAGVLAAVERANAEPGGTEGR